MNGIKYSSSTTETRAITKGNWYIGTGDNPKGLTQDTGYWTAVNPPAGGYTVYTPKEDQGPSIRIAKNDTECIGILKEYGYAGDSINDALLWSQSQDDILVVNSTFDRIITEDLVLYVDAGYVSSYPRTGTTWSDLSGNGNNGQLSGDVLFNNEGSFSLTELSKINISLLIDQLTEFTISVIYKLTDSPTEITILTKNSNVYQSEIVSQTQYYFIDILFQKNGTSVTQYLYINGNQISSKTDTEFGFINLSEFNVKIRKSKKILTPNIVSVKFYSKILSEEEIVSNYNSTNNRYNI